MRPDVYRQPEFAASPVRCDTFGPVAEPLWKLVGNGKRAAGVVRKMTQKRFVTVKFRLRAINSEPYICRRRLATFIILNLLPPVV